jgi:hypothetical protein
LWHGQQACPLSRGKNGTAGHRFSFLKMEVFDKPHPVTNVARKIKARPFSQIVLDMLFSISYHHNEF